MNGQIGHRRGRGWTVAAAALLGAALLAPPAGAQTKDELDKARVAFQEGVALMAANNCGAAVAKFQAVVKVKRTPQVLFNIGECEERLGKLVSALGNFRLAASAAEGDKKAKVVTAQVGQRIADLETRIPRLSIRRGAGAETATILLDGAELGGLESSAEIPVDPGSHAVVARIGDREAWSQTVSLEEKAGVKTVEVVIEAPPEKPPPPPERPPPPPPEPAPSKLPAVVVLSAGVASAVVGAVFLGLRGGALSDLDGMCGGDETCPPSAEDTADKGRLYTGLAEVTLTLGVVGIAAGVVMLVTSGSGDAKAGEADAARAEEPTGQARKPRRVAAAWRRGWWPEVVLRAPGADVGGVSVVGRF